MKVVYPYFREGDGSFYFKKYYGKYGNTMNEMANTLLFKPIYSLKLIFAHEKWIYLNKLFRPFLYIPILNPRFLLIVAAPIAVNLLAASDHVYAMNMITGWFHYDAEIFPILFIITMMMISNFKLEKLSFLQKFIQINQRQSKLVSYFIMATWLFYIGKSFRLKHLDHNWKPDNADVSLMKTIKHYIQNAESVTANQEISSHLTYIKKLYISDFYSYGKFRDRGAYVVLAHKLHKLDIHQQALEFKSK